MRNQSISSSKLPELSETAEQERGAIILSQSVHKLIAAYFCIYCWFIGIVHPK